MSIYAYQLLKGLGISEPGLLKILPHLGLQVFEPEESICLKGESPAHWTHILSGLVSARLAETDGCAITLNLYGPGTWVGESAIFSGKTSAHDFVCLAPTRVLNIPSPLVMEVFESESEFSRFFARLIIWRNQQHAEMLALTRNSSPFVRIVMGLSMLAETLECSASHLPVSNSENTLDINLKQSLLASIFDVSRGVFSGCAQQLEAAGWLKLSYATVRLVSLPTWRNFAKMQRETRQVQAKPSMQDILSLMQVASQA